MAIKDVIVRSLTSPRVGEDNGEGSQLMAKSRSLIITRSMSRLDRSTSMKTPAEHRADKNHKHSHTPQLPSIPASQKIVQYFSAGRGLRQSHRNWGKDKIVELQKEADVFLNVEELNVPEMPSQAPTFLSAAHLRSDSFWNDVLDAEKTKGPYKFLERRAWHILGSVCIVINVLLLNLDTPSDSPKAHAITTEALIEQAILIFSVVEFYMMVERFRAGFGSWHTGTEARIFTIVEIVGLTANVVDAWIFPLLMFVLPGCRRLSPFLRMLWLLRMVRLIGLVPQLHELFHGVLDALQGLFWVLVFMVLLLYAVAILTTRLIGQVELSEEAQEIQLLFKDTGTSMMTLFNIMTAWSLDPLLPFFDLVPAAKPWFVMFYIFEGWVLLAVMTGTVSFRMISSKAKIDTSEAEMQAEERRMQLTETLYNLFVQLDEDGNGEMSLAEFQAVLQSREIMRLLSEATSIVPKDLLDLFEWMDDDGSGVVSMDEFMSGFKWLSEPFNSKTMLKVRENISKALDERAQALVEFADHSTAEVLYQLEAPLRKIHAASDQANILTAAVEDFCGGVVPCFRRAAPKEGDTGGASNRDASDMYRELGNLEERIAEQLDNLVDRVSRIRVAGMR